MTTIPNNSETNKLDIVKECSVDITKADSNSIKKNTFYNILKTFSSVIFPLITFPYISRVLGAENVGKISFSSSIVSYFSLIATLGISAYAIRECSKVKNNKEQLSSTASRIYSINIITTVIAYISLFFCLFIPQLNGYRGLIIIQSMSILFTSIGTDWINTAMEDFRYITVRTFICQAIALIAMITFVHKPEHYIIFAIISLISSSGAQIANIVYRERFCKIRFTKNMNWKKDFPPIITMFVMLLAQSILNNLDITMIGFIKNDFDVGLYSTAVKVINVVQQLTISVTWVVIPQISFQYGLKNYKEINKILRYVFSFTTVIGLPSLIGINLFAEEIIIAIGGEEYIAAANCLRILSISMCWGYINNIFGNLVLLPSNREKRYMYACLTSVGINSVTNAFFIPIWGINGASFTTAISNMATSIINFTGIEKDICFNNLRRLLKGPIWGSLSLLCPCLLIKAFIPNSYCKLALAFIIGGFIYLIVLIMTKDEFTINTITPLTTKIKRKTKKNEKKDKH